MRLSIGDARATVWAIVSARWRKAPLQLIPPSVILPFATDTETPSGAMLALICSANAEAIFASKSLSARAERTAARPRNRGLSARSGGGVVARRRGRGTLRGVSVSPAPATALVFLYRIYADWITQ
jgi:hypothetical protein